MYVTAMDEEDREDIPELTHASSNEGIKEEKVDNEISQFDSIEVFFSYF